MMTDLLFTRWLTLKIAKRQLTSISLDRLASSLPDEAVKHTSEVFKDDKFKRRKKKGTYPYDYINSVTKFDEKLQQHSRWTYIWWSTNILKVHGIHSISVLWVNIVICIWSLIFFCLVMSENFRKTCLQYYNRDPCHYFTSPGLSWDAVFKMTDIKLEFKTDMDRLWERHVQWYHTFSTHM